jgi:hypothetical protein
MELKLCIVLHVLDLELRALQRRDVGKNCDSLKSFSPPQTLPVGTEKKTNVHDVIATVVPNILTSQSCAPRHHLVFGRSRLQETGCPDGCIVDFPTPSRQMKEYYFKLSHDHFIPQPFLLIILITSTIYSLSYLRRR